METLAKRCLWIVCLTFFVGQAFAQNELFEEASETQVTRSFSIKTEFGHGNFALHGTKDAQIQAKRVQEILEEFTPALFKYFKYAPEQTIHFRLNNSAKRLNGSATVLPRNVIVLNMFPPVGDEHLHVSDDWLQGLVIHELVHIIHLEQARGILRGFLFIAGNYGRLGGVIPRWFTEGAATWAETHFTKGGRLRQEGLLAQARIFLERDNFCQTIDCLDNPPEYPYGNFAYWVGAAFLDYLEAQKEGTISCIIKVNSYRIPFFARGAFNQCGITDIEQSFISFRKEFIKVESVSDPYLDNLKEISMYDKGEAQLQKNYQVVGSDLYFAQQKLDSIRFVKHDLKTGFKDIQYRDYYIDQVLKSSNELYTSTSDFRRLWVQKKIRKEKSILGEGDFIYKDSSGNVFFWRYHEKKWRLFDHEDQEVFALQELVDLKDVQNHYLLIKKNNDYQLIDFKNNKRVEHKFNHTTRLQAALGNDLIIKEDDGLHLYTQGKLYSLSNTWTKDLISLRASDKNVVYRIKSKRKSFLYDEDGFSKLANTLKKESKAKKVKVSEWWNNAVSSKDYPFENLTYPKLRYFKPLIWTFGFTAREDSSDYSAQTVLTDPLDRHNLTLGYSYFGQAKKSALLVDYTYNFYGTRFSIGSDESYIQNSQRVEKEKEQYVSIARNFFSGRYSYGVKLQGRKYIEEDIVSYRAGESIGLLQKLDVAPLFLDSFMRGFSTTALLRNNKVDGKSFGEVSVKGKLTLQPMFRLRLHLQGSFGKLDKSTLRDGALFSGDYNTNTLHEFIGLDSKSSFGNKVRTTRVQLDKELIRIHRGWGFSPFFLKKIDGVLGSDFLATDFIFIRSGRYLANQSVRSYYAGIQTSWTFAYFVPVRFDILRVKLKRPFVGDIDSTEFFFQAGLAF